jgi:hypothetical protein
MGAAIAADEEARSWGKKVPLSGRGEEEAVIDEERCSSEQLCVLNAAV